jgi:hypothetical protein
MVVISLSGGACNTIITEPIRHIAHPSFPNVPSSSFKKYDPNTAPIKTLNAPSGVTRIAGANAYAAKLATSPTITVHHVRIYGLVHLDVRKRWVHTRYDTGPPYWASKICEPISFEAMALFCIHQSLNITVSTDPILHRTITERSHNIRRAFRSSPYLLRDDKTCSCNI